MSDILKLYDGKINAWNYLAEMPIADYLHVVRDLTTRNEYQRRRVKTAHTVYSLLKEDILKGCIVPPIVLAFTGSNAIQDGKIKELLESQKDELVILDGLQRTYTFLELERDLIAKSDNESLKKLREQRIRVEVYVGVNRLGVLYRMLTLNTGQTPMTLRQQVEMLYLNYSSRPIDGIRLIREIEDSTPAKIGEYSFKDIVEGFNAYLERNELPIDRFDLLESIKSLEKLSLENQNADLFADYVRTYNKFVRKTAELSGAITFESKDLGIDGQPFGKDVLHIFAKSQSISGFGAALGKLKDFEVMSSFAQASTAIDGISIGGEPVQVFTDLLKKLDNIRLNSKKIGNAQRAFFQFFFRELFNPKGDSYLKIGSAVSNGYQKYLIEVSN